MSDFSTATTTQGALDPFKRVKYSLGLVLGVDEFDQEQTYLMARDHLHQRGLHGYGTVCGLQVSMAEGSPPEVLVSPGMAVNPLGQTIRVPLAQCARLNEWLANNETAVSDHLAPDNSLSLTVVLCYRECETDLVPMPGGPCRLQEDSMAASRIADDFELSFRFADELPAQVEEEVVRRFGALLHRLEITHEAAVFTTAEELADLVRALPEEPPETPDTSPIYLDAADSCATLYTAFRVWVTEVRPTLLADGRHCAGGEPDEGCVILGRLDMSLTAGGQVDGEVTVVDDMRPILLHSRLLQEWLLCGRSAGQGELSHTFATLSAPNETTVRAWLHHPRPLSLLAEAAVRARVNETAVSLTGITRPVPGLNVFDLALDGVSLSNDDRVAVHFGLEGMAEAGGGTANLAEIADVLDYAFLDRDNNIVTAFLVVVGFHGPLLERLPARWPTLDEVTRRRFAWALRLTTVTLLVGHAGLGLFSQKAGLGHHYASIGLGAGITPAVGAFEFFLAALVLLRPAPGLLIGVAAWKFATEFLFIPAGAPFWEVIERFGSYAAPLALALLMRRDFPRLAARRLKSA